MRKAPIAVLILAASLSFSAAPSPALAQLPGPVGINQANRPGFSPYLNLTRTDINPAVSYYGIVRPELAYNKTLQQVQAQQSNLQQQQDLTAAAIGTPATGVPSNPVAGFMTQSRYFMTVRPAAGGGFNAPGGK